eukprot:jgi/Antlo1/241/1912
MARKQTTSKKKDKSRYRIRSRFESKYGAKHLDQIKNSLCEKPVLEYNDEIVGNGQFYCVECDRFFGNEDILNKHKITKNHKRRVKALGETLHTNKDAEEAAGLIS